MGKYHNKIKIFVKTDVDKEYELFTVSNFDNNETIGDLLIILKDFIQENKKLKMTVRYKFRKMTENTKLSSFFDQEKKSKKPIKLIVDYEKKIKKKPKKKLNPKFAMDGGSGVNVGRTLYPYLTPVPNLREKLIKCKTSLKLEREFYKKSLEDLGNRIIHSKRENQKLKQKLQDYKK